MTAESTVQRVDAGTFFHLFNRLEEFEETAVALIPTLSDAELEEGIARAQALGETAWRIRAAFATEVASRANRLNGGRGKLAGEGQGVTQALAHVAVQTGVEVRTIQRDRQIMSTFKETSAINDRRINRQYFEIALSAPDPQKAIEVVQRKLDDDPNYTTRQFGDYVRALRDTGDKEQKMEEAFWLNIPISQEARRAMVELCKRRQLKPGEVVSQVLIDALEWSKK
jgi:hypothetical protein